MYHVTSFVRGLVLMAMLCVAMTSMLLADGNETLGPSSISIAAGSGYVSAGVGLAQSQPGIININVPAGATVNQVLIYWEGQFTTANGDDAITVGGNNVTGTLVGGPDYFFSNNGGTLPVYSSTYRADISSLDLVSAGANAISVTDLNNDIANNGAGIVVIYSDALPNNEIQMFDGNDLAYKFFPNPRGTMVAKTFTFTASSTPRVAKLSMFFSSVEGILSTDGALRPNQVTVTVGAAVTTFTNELLSNDGQEWDTMTKMINIPAGETQLTVVAESGPGGDEDPNTLDPKPASFAWNFAALGIQCTGKIGDFVFKDANCDGNQSGDAGISNVTVILKQGNVVLATTTTDINGHYEFDGLCLGEYTVEVDATTLPAGYVPAPCSNTPGIGDNSNCSPSPVVLTENNTEDLTIDFGYCTGGREIECNGKIGNFVWKDNDCDGTQDVGEPGIANVTVQLLDCAGENVLQTTTTDANGYYLFDSLCGGCYTVKVVAGTLPAGYTPTTCSNTPSIGDNSNCSPSIVLLPENNTEDLTIDFGYCAPPECSGKIGNFVWKDLNCNGTQNAGEPGIANVVVKLYRGATLLATATTDANGYYLFTGLCADCYTVKVDATTLPAGYTPTSCSNVANNNTNSNCSPAQVVLSTSSSQDLTIDFGYCAPSCCGKIGDRVWKDTDCDGYQDSGEPGIAGVTVKLYNGTTNALIATTTTNSSGYYEFTGLCGGCYTVKVEASTIPSGYTPTTCSNSSTSGTNSNCSPAGVVLSGNSSTNLTIDFGYCAAPPCIPVTFTFCGSTCSYGTAGNIRTFTSNGVSVKVSAFSREKNAATWDTGYLGLYSYGLGVTDKSEGDGSSNRHRVDNIDKNNYVLFEFSTPVTVTRAYLDAILTDSDISVWYGTFPSPYNNHLTLSDAVLASMVHEQDLTGSSSARWATFNGGAVLVNVLVIAADVEDITPEDWFKIRKIDITCAGGGSHCGGTAPGVPTEETDDSVTPEVVPATYSLMQNFPNPFNPTTQISFELPAMNSTTLKIYNTLGQEIKTLVNTDLDAGVYTYSWDATDNSGHRVASGVYFYQLRSGEFSSIKKMSLMK